MAAILFLLAGCAEDRVDYVIGWESVPCSIEPIEGQPDTTWATEFPVEGEPRPSFVWLLYSTVEEWQQGGTRWETDRGIIEVSGSRADPLTDCLLWLAE